MEKELKDKINLCIGIGILIFLIIVSYFLYQEVKLNKEISVNCGFNTEKWRCTCSKEALDAYHNNITFGVEEDNPLPISPLLTNLNISVEVNPLLLNK